VSGRAGTSVSPDTDETRFARAPTNVCSNVLRVAKRGVLGTDMHHRSCCCYSVQPPRHQPVARAIASSIKERRKKRRRSLSTRARLRRPLRLRSMVGSMVPVPARAVLGLCGLESIRGGASSANPRGSPVSLASTASSVAGSLSRSVFA